MKTAPKSPPSRPRSATTAPATRSKVTNGKALHAGPAAGNTAEGRRFRDLIEIFLDEAQIEVPTEIQMGLIRRMASATCQLESLEAIQAQGKPCDHLAYSRMDGVLRRARKDLGIGPTGTAPPAKTLDDDFEKDGLNRG